LFRQNVSELAEPLSLRVRIVGAGTVSFESLVLLDQILESTLVHHLLLYLRLRLLLRLLLLGWRLLLVRLRLLTHGVSRARRPAG
jgi:hypothetical protein